VVITVGLAYAYYVACSNVMKWSLCVLRHTVNPGRYLIRIKKKEEQKKKKRRQKSILRRVKNVLGTVVGFIVLIVLIGLSGAFVLYVSWYLGWRFVLSGEYFKVISQIK